MSVGVISLYIFFTCSDFIGEMCHRTKQLKSAVSQLKAVRNESQSHSSTLESTQELLSRLTEESSQHKTVMKEMEVNI